MIRNVAEFQTDLPDDMIVDEHDIVQFGGRGVTEAVAEMLAAAGYEVSEPIYCGLVGWELDIRAKGRRFWLRICQLEGDQYVLFSSDMTWRFWRRLPSYAEFLTELDRGLRRHGAMRDITWGVNGPRLEETRAPHPLDPQ